MEDLVDRTGDGPDAESRVRANTSREVNERIDREIEDRVRYYATRGAAEITRRLEGLDREWSVERVLEAEASSMGMLGVTLGATVNRKFLVLPAVVAGMVFLHAVQGWYPLLPVFRRMGFRTRKEIDRERYALKALRGDFDDVADEGAFDEGVREAWRAVNA